MDIRIFTLPFKPELEGFEDHVVQEFCKNKKVHEIKSEFFSSEGKAYWSVTVRYEVLLEDKGKVLPSGLRVA